MNGEDLTILLDKGIKVRMLISNSRRPPPLIIANGNESLREAVLICVISSSGEVGLKDSRLALFGLVRFIIWEDQRILPVILIFL